MKKLLAFSGIVILFWGCQSQQESIEPCAEYDAIDLQMLNTYDEIMKNYSGDEYNDFRKRMSMSQVYWIQYRDRFLKALYPKDQEDYREDNWDVYSKCKCTELTLLTKNRIKELNLWLDGSPSRQDCPSSIKK